MNNHRLLPFDENHRRVARQQLARSLVIEAGAGTGKTTLLVDRIISLIEKHGIGEILAVTFTEKAAEELIHRVRKGLSEKVAHGDVNKYIVKALDKLDTASISTIHAFASSIVRSHAIELGLDPEFGHIDPPEEKKMLRDELNKSLRRKDGKRQKLLGTFFRQGGSLSRLYNLTELIYTNMDIVLELPEINHDLSSFQLTGPLIDKVKLMASFAQEMAKDLIDGRISQVLNLLSSLPFSGGNQDIEAWDFLVRISSINLRPGKNTNWKDKEDGKLFKEQTKYLKEESLQILDEIRYRTLVQLLPWAQEIVSSTQSLKFNSGQIGFMDQLLEARGLMADGDILEKLKRQYKYLLIDEFQDTDPLQIEIALLLSSRESKLEDIFSTDLKPGSICIVGDYKQSIYRFRRADPEVYLKARETILRNGELVPITQNFRSAPGIIRFVNKFFRSIWDKVDLSQASYQEILPIPDRKESQPDPSVTILKPETPIENNSADDLRRAEAEIIACFIKNSIQNENWTVFTPDRKQGFRQAGLADYTLLFPSSTGIEIYGNALQKKGIPFRIEGGKRFYTLQIVSDLLLCLRALDNPYDKLSVVGTLRSNIFGISDSDITNWNNLANGEIDYRSATTGISTGLKQACETLNTIHQRRKSVPVYKSIEYLIQSTSIDWVLQADKRRWVEKHALERIQALSVDWAHKNGFGLRGFHRWLSDRIEEMDDAGGGTGSSSLSMVRLQTIHSAKGLEFPIVILANLQAKNPQGSKLIANRTQKGFEICIGSKESGQFKTRGYDRQCEGDKQAKTAEQMRLLYVAMTRARDHLIIPRVSDQKRKSSPGFIIDCIDTFFNKHQNDNDKKLWREQAISPEGHDFDSSEKTTVIKLDPSSFWSSVEDWDKDRNQRLKKAAERLTPITSPSQTGNRSELISENSRLHKSKSESDQMKIGIALHKYMAFCPESDELNQKLLKNICNEFEIDGVQMQSLISNCLQSEMWGDAISARRMWREVPVVAKLKTGIIKGRIDLIWEDKEGQLHLVDYKTGEYNENTQQLLLYTQAVKKATGKLIRSARLFYAATSKEIYLKLKN